MYFNADSQGRIGNGEMCVKIAVVDDERPARKELIFFLSSILTEAEFYEADSAKSALALFSSHTFQVCFLDINLGEVKGTALASMAGRMQPQAGVVFVTAYQDYAAEAFELDAVDYIMKPYDLRRLEKTVEKLRHLGFLKDNADMGKVAVSAGDRIRLMKPEEIILVEAIRHGSRIYTEETYYEEGTTLNQWEERLPGEKFFRVHKSYLVNLGCIKEIIPSYNNGYCIRLRGLEQTDVPISRTRYRSLRELFHF